MNIAPPVPFSVVVFCVNLQLERSRIVFVSSVLPPTAAIAPPRNAELPEKVAPSMIKLPYCLKMAPPPIFAVLFMNCVLPGMDTVLFCE